jgi:hypothetical protein
MIFDKYPSFALLQSSHELEFETSPLLWPWYAYIHRAYPCIYALRFNKTSALLVIFIVPPSPSRVSEVSCVIDKHSEHVLELLAFRPPPCTDRQKL